MAAPTHTSLHLLIFKLAQLSAAAAQAVCVPTQRILAGRPSLAAHIPFMLGCGAGSTLSSLTSALLLSIRDLFSNLCLLNNFCLKRSDKANSWYDGVRSEGPESGSINQT